MINSYLNLLANTDYNYGSDVSGVYQVEITAWNTAILPLRSPMPPT
jgi:hypothetical protein